MDLTSYICHWTSKYTPSRVACGNMHTEICTHRKGARIPMTLIFACMLAAVHAGMR